MEKYTKLTLRMALQLAAPHTWVASIYPAVFGIIFSNIKGYGLNIFSSIMLIAVCILMQSAVNTFNDYADYIKGTDSINDNVEKTDSVLVYNNVNPHHVLFLGILYLTLGASLGIYCSIKTGLIPLYIGAIGGAVVLLYSLGPLPLSYLPLGEAVSGIVMGGFIPLAVASAADNKLHLEVLAYSLPLIIGISLIMMTNNGCDIEKDKTAGRRTLPVIMGRNKTVSIYKNMILLWLTVLCILPLILFGIPGLICTFTIIIPGRKYFIKQMKSKLEQSDRISLMKGIVAANMFGGGAYIISAVIKLAVMR